MDYYKFNKVTNYYTSNDSTSITNTRNWTKNTSSTVSSGSADITVTKNDSSFSTTYTYSTYHIPSRKEIEEEQKRIKDFIKKDLIKRMKKQWNTEVIEKPIKPMRPTAQLRGVCFSGRGWA